MSKVAVVYWSGTGNTEAMANAVADGVKSAGAEVEIFKTDNFDASMIPQFNSIAFGCPAMGAETLEDTEFEPMFIACEPALKKKHIALFGSYGWGDGEWMQNWEDVCTSDGAVLVSESIICNEAPDESALEQCKNLGNKLATVN